MPPFSAPFLRQGAHLERVNLMREAYLDNSATTQVSPEVAKVIYESMCGVYGNPSSLHSKGLEAELELKQGPDEPFGDFVRGFAAKYRLTEEPQSKFARARRLR